MGSGQYFSKTLPTPVEPQLIITKIHEHRKMRNQKLSKVSGTEFLFSKKSLKKYWFFKIS
jgi:hypothetical protein